jgi:transcriptional regulator with XRE-family HTH domain
MELSEMIRREMKRKNFSNAELARKLRVTPPAIQEMLKSPNMQVSKLAQLSEVFQYNFFREAATFFPFTEPDYEVKIEEETVKPLQERVKALEMEVDILRRTLKDAVSR